MHRAWTRCLSIGGLKTESGFTKRLADLWEEGGSTFEAHKYTDTEKEVLAKNRIGRTFIEWMTLLFGKHEKELECGAYCDLLGKIGRVADCFEDKGWIHDAHSPFILSLAGHVSHQLDRLNHRQLLNAFYGLACLGPEILDKQLKEQRATHSVSYLVEALVNQAFKAVDRLDGRDRCQLIEGSVLVNQRLETEKLDHLLKDTHRLFTDQDTTSTHTVPPSVLASLLWALGKHGYQNRSNIVSLCLKDMCQSRRFGCLCAADMGRTIWGLGHMGIQTGHEDFMDKVHRYLQFTVDVTKREMFAHQIAEFAEGLSLLSYRKGKHDIMEYLVRDAARRQTPLSHQQKGVLIQACRSIGYPIR